MNPFCYTHPVPVEQLLDRDEETEFLLKCASEGTNTRLVAPRRYGKTSLLHRVQSEARQQGWATIYVDFFATLSLSDVAKRIELAYAEQTNEGLKRWFMKARRVLRPTVKAGGGPLPVGVEFNLDPQSEVPLLERLALPRKLYEEKGIRTLVVFDEFQDVLKSREGADGVIRSEIQHQGDAASYIFAGSHVGMMRELFVDRRRAFYGQARPLELSPLRPHDIAEYVDQAFKRSNKNVGTAVDFLIALTHGHPQRTMQLAYHLWEYTQDGGAADEQSCNTAFEMTMREIHPEFVEVWSRLNSAQARGLTAVAENRSTLYGANEELGGAQGGSVQRAVGALVDMGLIVEDGYTPTGYRLVDPLMGIWVNEGRGVVSSVPALQS